MSQPPAFPTVPFTRDFLDRCGVGRASLRAALETGQVRRVLAGVYVAASTPDSLELRARAVAHVVDPDQVMCDRTAAWLHGIDVLTLDEHTMLPPVETCAVRGRVPTERAGTRGRTRDLLSTDIVEVHGLRVTSPTRTALDLGCNLRRRDALAALDRFRREFGLTADDLAEELPRFRRRRGVVQLRQLIPLSDPRSESARESWVRLAILDDGLPCPELQWWVEVDGIPTYRLDHAYPLNRVAVEYDGAEFHLRTPDQRAADDTRRTWLREHGWTVIVVRRGDFTGRRLDAWLDQVRIALRPRFANLRW